MLPPGWGENGDAELLQRGFLKHLFGVRRQTHGAALLLEAERAPVMHNWVGQTAGWWNRVMARPSDDLVKVCLQESMSRASGTWGAAW
jgi:hypothetical protein